MAADRSEQTDHYLREVFAQEDDVLRRLMPRAVAAGVPDIAVSPETGRVLTFLARLVEASLIIEVGALAGYSAICLARGLNPGGRLISIEPVKRHIELARMAAAEAGLESTIEFRSGEGIPELRGLIGEFAPASCDVLFLDAIKTEYEAYLEVADPLLRPGGLVIADNALGSGEWWVTDAPGSHESRDAIDSLNRRVASDPRYDAILVPVGQGLLVARRREA